MNSLIWWMILLVVSLLAELSSPGLFFFVSFSAGAFAASIASYFDYSLAVEFALFVIVTAAAFIGLNYYVKRVLKDTLHASNVYALVGKRGVVTETLSDCQKGWVRVGGELWSALPAKKEMIEKGMLIEVVRSEGSTVFVKKIDGTC